MRTILLILLSLLLLGCDSTTQELEPDDGLVRVAMFGCETFDQLAEGLDIHSAFMVTNPINTSGNTIVEWGEADIGDPIFDEFRRILSVKTDYVIFGLCQDLDNRRDDTANFLPAGESGSDKYGELELVRRSIRNVAEIMKYLDRPLFVLPHPHYTPLGACSTVGANTTRMLERAVEVMVLQDEVDPMLLGFSIYSLPNVPRNYTTIDDCTLSTFGVQRLVLEPLGLDTWYGGLIVAQPNI